MYVHILRSGERRIAQLSYRVRLVLSYLPLIPPPNHITPFIFRHTLSAAVTAALSIADTKSRLPSLPLCTQ